MNEIRKNTSLLTFTVETVNSSYWGSYTSENLELDQDCFIWLMIQCYYSHDLFVW